MTEEGRTDQDITPSVDDAGGHGAGGEVGTGGSVGGIGTFAGGPDEPAEAARYREENGVNGGENRNDER